jgi:bacteriocin biosynthesis cyclodehydratase domain-containing protein
VNRPILIPGLPRIWRGPGELQLGADPARALVLRLPDQRTARVLDLLDGSRSEQLVLLGAAELGVSPEDCRALLDTLHAAGLTLPAASLMPRTLPPAARGRLMGEAAALAMHDVTRVPHRGTPPAQRLRRRAAARVVISGRGRLGAGIAVALAEAGVGHVRPDLPGPVGPAELAGGPLHGTDIDRPRRDAIIEAMSRAAPGIATGVRRGPASLVIQLDPDEPASLLAAAHAAHAQPHLAVTIREGAPVIGPLVPAAGAPCLNCLDLHRRERDAGWPGPPVRHGGPEPCAVTTLLAATAFATAEALTFLDGGKPETSGATVEITAPGRVRRRTWPPHPDCPCGRRGKAAGRPPAAPPPGPDGLMTHEGSRK